MIKSAKENQIRLDYKKMLYIEVQNDGTVHDFSPKKFQATPEYINARNGQSKIYAIAPWFSEMHSINPMFCGNNLYIIDDLDAYAEVFKIPPIKSE